MDASTVLRQIYELLVPDPDCASPEEQLQQIQLLLSEAGSRRTPTAPSISPLASSSTSSPTSPLTFSPISSPILSQDTYSPLESIPTVPRESLSVSLDELEDLSSICDKYQDALRKDGCALVRVNGLEPIKELGQLSAGEVISQTFVTIKNGRRIRTDARTLKCPTDLPRLEAYRRPSGDTRELLEARINRTGTGDYYIAPSHTPQIRQQLGLGPLYLNAGNRLLSTRLHYAGIHGPYVYVSGPGSTGSAFHTEDAGTRSANLLFGGAAKYWLLTHPNDSDLVETIIEGMAKALKCKAECSQFVRHLNVIPFPSFLAKQGIRFHVAIQEPGDLMLIDYRAYHFVVNDGVNVAEAINFAGGTWKFPILYRQCSLGCGCGASSVDEIITADGMTIKKYRKLNIADDPPIFLGESPGPKQSGLVQRPSTVLASRNRILRSTLNGDKETKPHEKRSGEDKVPPMEVASMKSRDELPSANATTRAKFQRTEPKDATGLEELSTVDYQQNEGAVDVIVTCRPGQNHLDIASEETPGTGLSTIMEQIGTANSAIVESIKKSLAWAKSASQSGQLKFPPDLSISDICCLDPEPLGWQGTDSTLPRNPNSSVSKPELKAPNWLSENLIFFLLRHMLMDKDDVQVLDPANTRSPKTNLCLDTHARTIFAPLNGYDTQWSLVVFNMNETHGEIVCYDTVDGTMRLVERVKDEIHKVGREIRWQSPNCVKLFPATEDSTNCGVFTIAQAEATIYSDSEDGRGQYFVSWDPNLLRLRYLQWTLELLSAPVLANQVRRIVKRKRVPANAPGPIRRPRSCLPFMVDSTADHHVPGRFKDAIQSLLPVSYQPWITFYERQLTSGRLSSEEVEKVLALAYAVACPQVFLDLATVLKCLRHHPYDRQDSLPRHAIDIYNRAGVTTVHDELQKRYAALFIYRHHQQLIEKYKWQMELDRKSKKRMLNKRATERSSERVLRSETLTPVSRQFASSRASIELIAESMDCPIEEAEAKADYDRVKKNIEFIKKEGERLGKLSIIFGKTFIMHMLPGRKIDSILYSKGSIDPSMYSSLKEAEVQLFAEILRNLRPAFWNLPFQRLENIVLGDLAPEPYPLERMTIEEILRLPLDAPEFIDCMSPIGF